MTQPVRNILRDLDNIRENLHFSTKPSDLSKPLTLANGIYAETNLSANHLCKSIQTLLDIFTISSDSITIFLRQDRDA
ncbi:MAG: hypothetical protein WC340_02560 [Kiritimatiellia bacterium]